MCCRSVTFLFSVKHVGVQLGADVERMVNFLAETLGCFNPFSQILRFFVASVLYSFASCILDSFNGEET